MHKYLSILFIARAFVNSNSRGETCGTRAQLQHVAFGKWLLSVISGYAIRAAMRRALEKMGVKVLRHQDANGDYGFGENNMSSISEAVTATGLDAEGLKQEYKDVRPFGLMLPKEGKGKTVTITSALQVSPALSTDQYLGDTGFGQGIKTDRKAKKSGGKAELDDEGNAVLQDEVEGALFEYEKHFSRYYFMVQINLEECAKGPNGLKDILPIIDTLKGLQIGGSQAANFSTMEPEALVWRFYDVPGQGGLWIDPISAQWQPDKTLDLASLETQAADRGITLNVAGSAVSPMSIADGIETIKQGILNK